MAIGNDFYPDQGFTDLANLYRTQSNQSIGYGDQAARYADPFMGERGKYQKQLSDLLANPGGFASSPVYKFAYDQGLEALNRKGSLRSGNKLAALQKYGQDMASQQYFPQAQLLSNLAMSGSSPASAGLSYARGVSDSQAQRQMSETLRAANRMQQPNYRPAGTFGNDYGFGGGSASTLPTGGASGGYTGAYSAGGTFGDPRTMSLAQLNAEAALYGGTPRYPSVNQPSNTAPADNYSSLDMYGDYGNWGLYPSALNGGGSFNEYTGYDPFAGSALNGSGSFNDYSGG